MTCDSIDSRPMRSRRASSRSTSLRTSSVSGCAASFFFSSSRSAASLPSPSPSSFWIARSCSRRSISRWRSPICSFTLDWMSSCAERTPICRWTCDEDAPQAVLDGERLEELLAVGRRDVDVAGDEVRETARARRPGRETARRLPRAGPSSRPARRRARAPPCGGREKRVLRVGRRHLGRVHHDGLEHPALLLDDAHRDAAALSLRGGDASRRGRAGPSSRSRSCRSCRGPRA